MLRNIKPMNKFCRWQIQQGRYYQQQRKEKKGKKGRGKPRVTWTKTKKIQEWLGLTYNECVVVNLLSRVIFIFDLFQLH